MPDDEVDAHVTGVAAALTLGWDRLRAGASALDVVEEVVRALESDPTFNAGRGSHLNAEGNLEMDASIMEGGKLRAGAVAAISGVRHPVSVARRVLEDGRHVLLVGEGALRFARASGAELCRPTALLVGRELERFRAIRRGRRSLVEQEFRAMDTVGAVALDRRGRTAAATSTGGHPGQGPGSGGGLPDPGSGRLRRRPGWGPPPARGGARASCAWCWPRARWTRWRSCRRRPRPGRRWRALRRVEGQGGVILVDRAGPRGGLVQHAADGAGSRHPGGRARRRGRARAAQARVRIRRDIAWFLGALRSVHRGAAAPVQRRHPQLPDPPPRGGELSFAILVVLGLVGWRERRLGAVGGEGIRLGSLTPLLLMLFVEKWVAHALLPPLLEGMLSGRSTAEADARLRALSGLALLVVSPGALLPLLPRPGLAPLLDAPVAVARALRGDGARVPRHLRAPLRLDAPARRPGATWGRRPWTACGRGPSSARGCARSARRPTSAGLLLAELLRLMPRLGVRPPPARAGQRWG
jgi:beta-aspartyl-peptidase (threonine type)